MGDPVQSERVVERGPHDSIFLLPYFLYVVNSEFHGDERNLMKFEFWIFKMKIGELWFDIESLLPLKHFSMQEKKIPFPFQNSSEKY